MIVSEFVRGLVVGASVVLMTWTLWSLRRPERHGRRAMPAIPCTRSPKPAVRFLDADERDLRPDCYLYAVVDAEIVDADPGPYDWARDDR